LRHLISGGSSHLEIDVQSPVKSNKCARVLQHNHTAFPVLEMNLSLAGERQLSISLVTLAFLAALHFLLLRWLAVALC